MTLSPREQQVARLVRLGYTNEEIAQTIGVTRGTVRDYLRNAYLKIDVKTRNPRVELATWYVRNNAKWRKQ